MKKHSKRIAAAASALLLTGLLIADSKYNITITERALSFDKLPSAFEDFHIVQLSDLHGMEFGEDNEVLVEKIKSLKPDIIAITGDMADNMRNIHVFETLLKGISGIAPIYYVSGNHEWGGRCMEQVAAMLEEYGVTYLANSYEPIYRSGEKIIIAGVDDPMGRADMIKPDELAEKLRGEYPEEFTLLLGHRNYWVEEYSSLPVDLILCGHAHGGIVRLPLVGGLLNVKHSLIASYEKGLYEGDEFVLSVSCGLGNSVPVPRFLNRPEIVSIKLKQS